MKLKEKGTEESLGEIVAVKRHSDGRVYYEVMGPYENPYPWGRYRTQIVWDNNLSTAVFGGFDTEAEAIAWIESEVCK